jgi:glycosyltransferase involved in cell wall biosynthesis
MINQPAQMLAAPDARVATISWAGDYGEAWKRIEAGGPETYYAQRYSVNATAELAKEVAELTVICLHSPVAYEEVLSNGVRAIGLGVSPHPLAVLRLLERLSLTHLVLGLPDWRYAAWALIRGVKLLPVLADSFRRTPAHGGLRPKIREARKTVETWLLARLLGRPSVRWVSNHNLPASRDLVRIGIDAKKIVPWDWPPAIMPSMFPAKSSPVGRRAGIVFVGEVVSLKGVGDLIRAAAIVKKSGLDFGITVIGAGEIEAHRSLAADLGLADDVVFLGRRPHSEVIDQLRKADIAIVPSWHEYSEGLPMTIYESLATRTPLICSDHPMFVEKLAGRVPMYPAKDVDALAGCVQSLLRDPTYFEKLSASAEDVWKGLLCEMRSPEVVRAWLRDSPKDHEYLSRHSLFALDARARESQVTGQARCEV